jgi:redox-sensitive bicupin YhaK (pirin superfamily)
LRLVASPDGRDGSLIIHQDASVFLGSLDAGSVVTPSFGPDRYGWLQVLRGTARVDDEELAAGDGAAISDAPGVVVHALQPAEVMLFDLP